MNRIIQRMKLCLATIILAGMILPAGTVLAEAIPDPSGTVIKSEISRPEIFMKRKKKSFPLMRNSSSVRQKYQAAILRSC